MKKILMVIFTVFLLAGCAMLGTHSIQGVLKGSNDYTVTVRGVSGALTIDKLFPEIASMLVEFGADSSAVAEYTRGQETYTVETISFLSAKSALGVYTLLEPSGAESLKLGYAGSKSAASVQFVKGDFYVRILPGRGADTEGALGLAWVLVKRIPGATIPPDLYEFLPHDRLIKGSAFYFKGSHAFQMRFPPDLAKILSINGAIEGVSGKYLLEGGNTVTLLKVHYTSRTRTVEALQSFLASREGMRIIPPRQNTQYYTLINPDETEVYIAEYGEWLLMFPDGPKGGEAIPMFEYMLRSL
ncbi:MAG: hypothetical protein Q8O92_08725 [Candidatus Latescibacter sp.]|nr:hypothetical protein [Candidatus Latescibacter sp.]